MKSLQEFVNEADYIKDKDGKYTFNPNLSSHAKIYNQLIKWYDKAIARYMNKDEAISCMKYAVEQWENDKFDDI